MEVNMARTGNNIYKRKDGRYEGRVLIGKTCRRKPRYVYVYARTLKEVKRKMEEIRENGITEKEKGTDISMQAAAEEWLRRMQENWKPTTCGMYRSVVSHYVIPLLGDYAVTEIGKELFEEFARDLDGYSQKQSLSERYKKYICSIVRQIMDYTENAYQLEKKGPPVPAFRVPRQAAQLPPKQDLLRLRQYLLEHLEEDTCLGILVAMNTGIRIGELCALQWGDFDLESGELVIRRNLQRVRSEDGTDKGQKDAAGKTRVCMQMPKTTSSIRVIPLADGLSDILRAFRRPPEKYLISGKKKAWSEARTLQYRFSAILKKCGIQPFHFHLLRHAFASQCVELGCDIKSLSEILGHSSVQITMNIYVHSSTKQKKELMNLVCRLDEKEQKTDSGIVNDAI